MEEVFHALGDAIILVAIVVLLFLQDWKPMILPMIDAPVSPIGTLATIEEIGGPVMITRYNMRTSATINGASLPGVSTGQTIATMEQLAKSALSRDLTFEWTELTYLQLIEGSAAIFAFIGAVLLVFQVLAAQYESWTMPLAVLMVVPMCLLSAVAGLWMWKLDLNIFVQVGLHRAGGTGGQERDPDRGNRTQQKGGRGTSIHSNDSLTLSDNRSNRLDVFDADQFLIQAAVEV